MLGFLTSRLRRTLRFTAPFSLLLLSDSFAQAHFIASNRLLRSSNNNSTADFEVSDGFSTTSPSTKHSDSSPHQKPRGQPPKRRLQEKKSIRPSEAIRSEDLETAPQDPDSTEFMPAPYGQLRRWASPSQGPLTRGFSLDRRLQITILPSFASLRLPFIARPLPIRGGGAALEVDLRLLRWLWLRAQTGHTVHPVQEEAQIDEEEEKATILAKSGTISATHAGLSLVYAMDTGRVMPMIDLGLDAMWIRSPEAAQNGQMGGKCNKGNTCEIGLSCRSSDRTCQPTVLGQIHAGIGVDYLLALHWSVGIHVRYFARIRKPAEFPVYLLASARAAFRF